MLPFRIKSESNKPQTRIPSFSGILNQSNQLFALMFPLSRIVNIPTRGSCLLNWRQKRVIYVWLCFYEPNQLTLLPSRGNVDLTEVLKFLQRTPGNTPPQSVVLSKLNYLLWFECALSFLCCLGGPALGLDTLTFFMAGSSHLIGEVFPTILTVFNLHLINPNFTQT